MSVTVDVTAGAITLPAPASGRVRLLPPGSLCGDLEVFSAGEAVASVDGIVAPAPSLGFVLRVLTHDGAVVAAGDPLVEFRVV